MSKNLHVSLSTGAQLTEGLCFDVDLTLTVANTLVYLVGIRTPTVSKVE
jgi:hypothetical protein